jgi:hypothetical protein
MSAEDQAWFTAFWEASQQWVKANDRADPLVNTGKLTREEANKRVVSETADEGVFRQFLNSIGQFLDQMKYAEASMAGADPEFRAEYEAQKEALGLQLRHGYWSSSAVLVFKGKEVDPKVLKALHLMIKNHPDEYRLAYGLFMGRDELIDVEGKSEREELLERVRGTAGMQEKWEHTVSAATPGELKGIAQKVTADEIAAKIEDGSLTENDEGLADYRKVKKQEAARHSKAIEELQGDIDDELRRG